MASHQNLMSLTHDTCGIIYYPEDSAAFAVDWSGLSGFPKIGGKRLVGEETIHIDIPDVDPVSHDDLFSCFSGAVSFYDCIPDHLFVYHKGEPWLVYNLGNVCGTVTVVLV